MCEAGFVLPMQGGSGPRSDPKDPILKRAGNVINILDKVYLEVFFWYISKGQYIALACTSILPLPAGTFSIYSN
jgi:hypothetical protein